MSKLEDAFIREFDGGLNVVDNDLNLTTKYSKEETNVYRGIDGSKKVRYGTKLFTDINNQDSLEGKLVNPFTTKTGFFVVTVAHTDHGMITGHKIIFNNAVDVGGVPADDLNAEHIITVIDKDTYTIVVPTDATSDDTGGGDVDYTINNFNINSEIVHTHYYKNSIVYFCRNGEIGFSKGDGLCTVIWNNDIAFTQAGSPAGWTETLHVDTDIFNGQLIACNGIDKPLLIDLEALIPCQYLVDLGSGSNFNTPIAKYLTVLDRFVVMGNLFEYPDRISISNRDTSGTYYGDAPPNDAIYIDIGKVVSVSKQEITGVNTFRGTLVVAFEDALVLYKLGTYNSDGDHVPELVDVITQYGTHANNSIVSIGNDLFMNDMIGVPSLSRTKLTNSLNPERVSQLIDPLIQKNLDGLTTGQLEDVWALHNQLDNQYMLFIPSYNEHGVMTKTTCYVYSYNITLRIKAWSIFDGWNFKTGCVSSLKRVFLCKGTQIFLYGTEQDPYYKDYIGSDDEKQYEFVWELPWSDFRQRGHTKHTRYIALDVIGMSRFFVEMFVDNKYNNKATGELTPELSMEFQGADVDGFGGDSPYYGGGRRTEDKRLYAWTSKFNISKLRFSGLVTGSLSFIAIGLFFKRGSIRR